VDAAVRVKPEACAGAVLSLRYVDARMQGKSATGEPDTIPHLISRAAVSDPAATAIAAPGREPLAYGALLGLIGAASAGLAERGIGRTDRISLVVGNGPEAATAFLSLACAATCAPLNPSYRREELEFFVGDVDARAVVVGAELDTPVREVARASGIPVLELEGLPGSAAGTFGLDGLLPATAEIPERSADDCALLLHTSGTTSRPKLVPLSHRNLAVSARNVASTLELRPADRCLNLMPLFHIHGLVAALLASLGAGASVACTPGFHAIHAFGWLSELEPTWLTAVPTMHQALLGRAAEHPSAVSAHRLRFLRSSSAALPTPVLEELERVFGVPVIEAYGMTEAAHQMASNPLPPDRRKSGSVGRAAGPSIAVLSHEGVELPSGSVGEIAIRGESVFGGYEGNPEANAAAFVDGWFRTGDEGVLDQDGYLTISGRIKELINRGGEKVVPLEVDERLLSHPAVAEAVTFSVPDPRLGEEIAAAIVLTEGKRADERELQDFAAQTLAPFKVPRTILIVDEIPKGPTGKTQRIGLADRLGVGAVAPVPEVREEARTAVERLIAGTWANVLGVPSFGRHDDFFALGGDSILAAEAVSRIREIFGRPDLPLVSIVRAPTVAKMVGELDGELSAVNHSGPIQLGGSPHDPPFFFVHGGDGEVLGFVALARAVGAGCSFFGIRGRGLDGGEAPHESIDEMAAGYVDAVREIQPRGPYALGGFCLGATLAIEMASRLEAMGETASLVVVDPRLPRPWTPRYGLWVAGDRAQRRNVAKMTLRRLGVRRFAPSVRPSPIERTFAKSREAHRLHRCTAPAVSILSDENERYGIPRWYVQQVIPNVHFIRIHALHERLLMPPHVGQLAGEIRAALGLPDSPG
jgi:oxalate---CoA ligase